MKKSIFFVLIAVMAICVCCGPYGDYSGTYSRSDSEGTYTITLSSSGKFKYERKLSENSSMHGTLIDTDRNNIREGTFTADGNKLTFTYKVYDEPSNKYVETTSSATLSGNKLVVSRTDDLYSEIYGTFGKK